MRYSTSGEQNLETSIILDFVHQLLFTNMHRRPPLVLLAAAALSFRCSVISASCMLFMASFSPDSVKHKILQLLMSRWYDSRDRSSSILLSNDCMFSNTTDGRCRLPTQRRILTRHPTNVPNISVSFSCQ